MSELKTTVEWVKLGEGGRVVIPADLRAVLGLKAGHLVGLRLDGCELRLFSVAEGVRKSQAIAAKFRHVDNPSVDDFIAERRAEAARE